MASRLPAADGAANWARHDKAQNECDEEGDEADVNAMSPLLERLTLGVAQDEIVGHSKWLIVNR
ncbi:MAG: hypothetical protein ACR2FX_08855 [Chthoniobacterales bacterium]